MEILLKINYSPNSMNLWNHIKTQLKKKTNISGCKINLEKKNSENKLISDIKKIHNERLQYEDV